MLLVTKFEEEPEAGPPNRGCGQAEKKAIIFDKVFDQRSHKYCQPYGEAQSCAELSFICRPKQFNKMLHDSVG